MVSCDECDAPAKSRGKCSKHYQRARRSRNARSRQVTSCNECDAPATSRGKCSKHYQRARRRESKTARSEMRDLTRDWERRNQIVAWYDEQMLRVDTDNMSRPIGAALVDQWQIEGALALLTKLHSRRPDTLLYDPDYEFTGGLLRCLQAGRLHLREVA